MEKKYRCILCGAIEAERNAEGEFYCYACKGRFNEALSKKQEAHITKLFGEAFAAQRMDEFYTACKNLNEAVTEKFVDEDKIKRCCGELRKFKPEDFRADFYEAVCNGNAAEINKILAGIDVEEDYPYIYDALNFILKNPKYENLTAINNLIARAYEKENIKLFGEFNRLTQKKSKEIDDGIYDVALPRDCFIAYKSENMSIVEEVVEYLEEEGLTCFVAARNLPHGSISMYESELKTAIQACKSFVFISTEASRMGGDARNKEMPIVKSDDFLRAPAEYAARSDYGFPIKYKKPRAEYVVDEYKGKQRENVVKEFFDGFERVYAPNLEELVKRINDQIDPMSIAGKEAQKRKELEEREAARKKDEEEAARKQRELEEEAARKKREAEEEAARIRLEAQKEAERILHEAQERAQAEINEQARAAAEQKAEEERKRQEAERKAEEEEAERKKREAAAAAEEELRRLQESLNAAAQKAEEETNNLTLDNYNRNEFEIENTVLKKYKGKGGDVKIPQGITEIGENAFKYYSNLTSITIPNGVTEIGDRAFERCGSLTSVEIPNSVTSIGDYAFNRCESLKSITIPNSVTSIGRAAFWDCSSLTSIEIPNSVTSIGEDAFDYCDGLASIIVESSNKKYHDAGNCLIETATKTLIRGCANSLIPTDGSVTTIGEDAFYGCRSLTSITIPNSVTSIGRAAFWDCRSLTSITIPNNVTSIGSCAFSDCSRLTSITIPNSVTSIGEESAFSDCRSLTSIEIPNSVTSIGSYAFRDCRSLTSITIPSSVTSIGKSTFYSCSRLTSITFTGTKKEWGEIQKGENWDRFTGNYTIHCTDGDIQK